MSFQKKVLRNNEKNRLKSEIALMLKYLGVSKRLFHKTLPKLDGFGYKYGVSTHGGNASLRQKFSFLKDLYEYKLKQDEESKNNLNKDEEKDEESEK
jgi:hypothetical protein